jgi:hypothetical protein
VWIFSYNSSNFQEYCDTTSQIVLFTKHPRAARINKIYHPSWYLSINLKKIHLKKNLVYFVFWLSYKRGVLIKKGNQKKYFPPKRLTGICTKTSFVMLMLQSWLYVRLLHGFLVYHIYITLNMQFVNYHIMEHQIKLFKRPNLKLVCPFC